MTIFFEFRSFMREGVNDFVTKRNKLLRKE